jgi:hypothetical protein
VGVVSAALGRAAGMKRTKTFVPDTE